MLKIPSKENIQIKKLDLEKARNLMIKHLEKDNSGLVINSVENLTPKSDTTSPFLSPMLSPLLSPSSYDHESDHTGRTSSFNSSLFEKSPRQNSRTSQVIRSSYSNTSSPNSPDSPRSPSAKSLNNSFHSIEERKRSLFLQPDNLHGKNKCSKLVIKREKVLDMAKSFEKLNANINSKESEFKESTTIDIIINHIINNILKSKNDAQKWISIFENNLITTYGILCRIKKSDLSKLKLPLALENEINILLNNNKKNGNIKNPLTGITDKNKQMIFESWNNIIKEKRNSSYILTSPTNLVCNFFDMFYKTYFLVDSSAKNKLERLSESDQSKKIFKLITTVIKFLENPWDQDDRIADIAIENIVTGFGKINSELLAYSVSEAINLIDMKKSWFSITKKVCKIINKKYDKLCSELEFRTYIKKTKKWRKTILKISPLKIIFKEFRGDKTVYEILMSKILNVSRISEEDDRFTKQTNFCLELSLKEANYLICTDIEEDLENILKIFNIITEFDYDLYL